MALQLEDDRHCFVCGDENENGLRLAFTLIEGKVCSEFTFLKAHQGYKDIVHGGLLSAVLDEAMVKASVMQGMPAVTAEITVRFRSPLLVNERVSVEAEIRSVKREIVETSAVIKKHDSTLVAEGWGKLFLKK